MPSDGTQSGNSEEWYSRPPPVPRDQRKRKKPMGRPKAIEDIKKLEAFMSVYPTLKSTATFFGVSPNTVERHIKLNYGTTFSEFRERFMLKTRHALVQKALHRALVDNSDRILEMCLKNVAGWDSAGSNVNLEAPVIQLQYNLDGPAPTPQIRDVEPIVKTEE